MCGSILISFQDEGPRFSFSADSDEDTAALQKWVESNLCGRPSALMGEGPDPSPAQNSLSGGEGAGSDRATL